MLVLLVVQERNKIQTNSKRRRRKKIKEKNRRKTIFPEKLIKICLLKQKIYGFFFRLKEFYYPANKLESGRGGSCRLPTYYFERFILC